jgi:hypothetical protein
MSQVLHIFKKDARHLWPEILASLVLTGIFAKIYPHIWAPGFRTSGLPDILPAVVVVLIPISWWVMLTRLVHDEPLVGDRQFWVTRPYQWQQLLAAKLLFLAVFLYLPLLIAQSVLLRVAGFHPSSYLPGLFFNLLLITFFLIVPMMVLATVTSGFAKAALTLLGVVVGIIGLAVLSSLWSEGLPDTKGGIAVALLVCALGIAVILVQYVTRNLRLARWLLAAAGVMIAAMALNWPGRALVPIEYPQSSVAAPPVHLAFDSDPSHRVAAFPAADDKQLSIRLPLAISGVVPGTAIQAEAVKFVITAPNGLNWSSSWQNARQYFTPGEDLSTVNVLVDRAFLEKVKDLPVQIHMTWALSRLRAGATGRATVSDEEFTIPDGGICALQGNDYTSFISCRFPMRQPRLTRFSAMWSRQRCFQPESPDAPPAPASGWLGILGNFPAKFGITSVWTSTLYFPVQGDFIHRPGHTNLCPGTPINFTEYTLTDRSQLDLFLPEMRLPDRPQPFPTQN